MKTAWVLVAACLTLATTAGCSGDGGAPAPAEGMQRVRGSGYVFDAPKGWVRGAVQGPDSMRICPEEERVNGFGTNINVNVGDAGGATEAKSEVANIKQGMELIGGHDIARLGDTSLDGVAAISQTAQLEPEGFSVRNIQVLAIRDGKYYTLTYTGERSIPMQDLQRGMDAVVASWHWTT